MNSRHFIYLNATVVYLNYMITFDVDVVFITILGYFCPSSKLQLYWVLCNF